MKSKQELIDYIARQTNITLENNKNDILNDRRKFVYHYHESKQKRKS